MYLTIQYQYQTFHFEFDSNELVHNIDAFLCNHYNLEGALFDWFAYYEMPNLLNLKLLRKLERFKTLTENGVTNTDVLVSLDINNVQTFFQELSKSGRESGDEALSKKERHANCEIDPSITVLDLKHAVQLQLPSFYHKSDFDLFKNGDKMLLKEDCSLTNCSFGNGDAVLIKQRKNLAAVVAKADLKPSESSLLVSLSPPSPCRRGKDELISPKPVRTLLPTMLDFCESSKREKLPSISAKRPPVGRPRCASLEKPVSSVKNFANSLLQFDNYIEQINKEECDLLLTVVVKGDFSHLLPSISSHINVSNLSQVSWRMKASSSVSELKQEFLKKLRCSPSSYHVSFFSHENKDPACQILDSHRLGDYHFYRIAQYSSFSSPLSSPLSPSVSSASSSNNSIVLYAELTESLSSKISGIYYSMALDDYHSVNMIYPPSASAASITTAVPSWEVSPGHLEFIPVNSNLFVSFHKSSLVPSVNSAFDQHLTTCASSANASSSSVSVSSSVSEGVSSDSFGKKGFFLQNVVISVETVGQANCDDNTRNKVDLTEYRLDGTTFVLIPQLLPFHFYKLVISSHDQHQTRQITIPFYSVEKLFSELLSVQDDQELKEPFSHNPFDIYIQHLSSSSSFYFSQLQTRRIIVKGRFPPVFLPSSTVDSGALMTIENEDAEIIELPLCFYYSNLCYVEDIKKKLILLFHAMNKENIHLFVYVSTSSSLSSCAMCSNFAPSTVRVEIKDKTSLNDLFLVDDMIVEFEFEILLENYLITAYYVDKEQTAEEKIQANQENQEINKDHPISSWEAHSVKSDLFEFPLFDSFSALINASSTNFLPILPNDLELKLVFTEELTKDLLLSMKHLIIRLKNINKNYSLHPVNAKYTTTKSSFSSSSQNEIIITSSERLIPSCFYELSFIYYNKKNEERCFTILFKTKKVVGFMMNYSSIGFSSSDKISACSTSKRGRKRKNVEKPGKPRATDGRKRRGMVFADYAADNDDDDEEEHVEEDDQPSAVEKVLKHKKTKRSKRSNQLYEEYSTIMTDGL
jgi:hypothetical protein